MKTEHCAGGIILRKSRNCWQLLLIKDMSGNWTFPKGKIEKGLPAQAGESSLEAAVREIKEEVGLFDLSMVERLSSISYTYKRNGIVKKTVDYFLFISTIGQSITLQKEEGIQDAKWVTVSDALKAVGYPQTYIPLVQKVQALVSKFS